MSLCVQLRLQGVRVLVVGGGRIAFRKCCQLEQEGADIVVVAKQFDALFQGAAYPCITDCYRAQQLQGRMLVIACCDDPLRNAQICEDAKKAGIFAMSVQQDTQATMHALAAEEGLEYILAAGTKGASPLLAKKMLKEMNELVQREYASRISLMRSLRQYILHHVQQDERQQLLTLLSELSEHNLRAVNEAVQGRRLLLLCFHGVKDDVTQELHEFCAAIEQQHPEAVTAIAFLSAAVCAMRAQLSVEQWMQLLKPLNIEVALVPMLFQNGRYYSRLLNLQNEHVAVKPVMFQNSMEVGKCLEQIRRDSGCSRLLVVYHSCVNGAFCELLEDISASNAGICAVHEKQTQDCELPWHDETIAVLLMYMLRGHHYRKDSAGDSALVQRLQQQNCKVHVLSSSCIEQKPFQELMIKKMME